MTFKIIPPIGIARVGNSPDAFFIGPEAPGSMGVEITASGAEAPLTNVKDSTFRIKRQAARFRIFEFDGPDAPGRLARFPAGTVVRWHVALANRKDSVVRQNAPAVEGASPGAASLPVDDPTRSNRAILAEGVAPPFGAAAAKLSGTYLSQTREATTVLIGELRSDRDGNLLVLGGHGVSKSPEKTPIGDEPEGGGFYNNRGWFDDVSDGRVTAEISLPNGELVRPAPSWVVVAPPDYAPATPGVVTLYDVMFQVAVERGEVRLAERPSFSRDILPILRRAAGLRWVNSMRHWREFSTDWAASADPSTANSQVRQKQARLLREIHSRNVLRNFSLRRWQEKYLSLYESGNFVNDFAPSGGQAEPITPEVLTRTSLDAAVGQGFFPGIEAGIVVMNSSLYSEPFRFDSQVQPGDLTALMALPWQADFYDCEGQWWPSQRPDSAHQSSNPATHLEWHRPLSSSDTPHRDLVKHFGKLGIILPRMIGGQEVFVETERDPNF